MRTINSVRKAVEEFRSSGAAKRGIYRNRGMTRATTWALERHIEQQQTAIEFLLPEHRRLVGQLIEEEKLAERLRVARLDGQERPELQARVNTIRKALRRFLGDLREAA